METTEGGVPTFYLNIPGDKMKNVDFDILTKGPMFVEKPSHQEQWLEHSVQSLTKCCAPKQEETE